MHSGSQINECEVTLENLTTFPRFQIHHTGLFITAQDVRLHNFSYADSTLQGEKSASWVTRQPVKVCIRWQSNKNLLQQQRHNARQSLLPLTGSFVSQSFVSTKTSMSMIAHTLRESGEQWTWSTSPEIHLSCEITCNYILSPSIYCWAWICCSSCIKRWQQVNSAKQVR